MGGGSVRQVGAVRGSTEGPLSVCDQRELGKGRSAELGRPSSGLRWVGSGEERKGIFSEGGRAVC